MKVISGEKAIKELKKLRSDCKNEIGRGSEITENTIMALNLAIEVLEEIPFSIYGGEE